MKKKSSFFVKISLLLLVAIGLFASGLTAEESDDDSGGSIAGTSVTEGISGEPENVDSGEALDEEQDSESEQTEVAEDEFSAEEAYSSEEEAEASSKKFPISGSLSLTYVSDLYERDAYEHQSSASFSTSLAYGFENGIKIGVKVSGSAELEEVDNKTKYRNEGWDDGWVSISKGSLWSPFDGFNISGSLRGAIPMSENSIHGDTLKTAVWVVPGFSYTIFESLTFSYSPQYTQYFHKYKQKPHSAAVNTKRKVTQSGSVSYTMFGKVTIAASFGHNKYWNHDDKYQRETYSASQSLTWQALSFFGVTVGHSLGGRLIDQERGPDKDIEFYDKERSSVFVSASASF